MSCSYGYRVVMRDECHVVMRDECHVVMRDEYRVVMRDGGGSHRLGRACITGSYCVLILCYVNKLLGRLKLHSRSLFTEVNGA